MSKYLGVPLTFVVGWFENGIAGVKGIGWDIVGTREVMCGEFYIFHINLE